MAKPKFSEELTAHDVARAVAGSEPPEWLVDHFHHWAPSIMLERSIAAMAFTRADAREGLTNIDRAAEILICAVAYAPSRELLERTDLGAIPEAGELVLALRGVQSRALSALQSPGLVTADGTAPRGRGRVGPEGATHPKVMVAGMIALAWEDVRVRRPGPRNKGACEAADLLWRYTTVIMERGRLDKRLGLNEEAARGNDRLTQWRRYFEAALAEEPILGSNHNEYPRHLRESGAEGKDSPTLSSPNRLKSPCKTRIEFRSIPQGRAFAHIRSVSHLRRRGTGTRTASKRLGRCENGRRRTQGTGCGNTKSARATAKGVSLKKGQSGNPVASCAGRLTKPS